MPWLIFGALYVNCISELCPDLGAARALMCLRDNEIAHLLTKQFRSGEIDAALTLIDAALTRTGAASGQCRVTRRVNARRCHVNARRCRVNARQHRADARQRRVNTATAASMRASVPFTLRVSAHGLDTFGHDWITS
ncbi:hypothetical protein C8R44DRAFT_864648 [Mycena epipterygia]|nr:hypothetical protein C8R44DRAFT_864648 [Mycena epipterygia]